MKVKRWVKRQKLVKNCDSEISDATLSHKIKTEGQKLLYNCDFVSDAPFAQNDGRTSRTEVKLRLCNVTKFLCGKVSLSKTFSVQTFLRKNLCV